MARFSLDVHASPLPNKLSPQLYPGEPSIERPAKRQSIAVIAQYTGES
jgi:hypothetical protein